MSRFPKFRLDLETFEHHGSDGRSLKVVKDPVAQQYFRLSDYEYRFLVKLDGSVSPDSVVNDLGERGFYYSREDVGQIMGKAAHEGLLLGTEFGTATFQSRLKDRLQSAKRSQSLLRLYFLFIPIWNPDRFLERTLWAARLCFNKWTLGLVALAVPGAIYLLISGLPRIESEFLFFFNLNNLIYLWVTIALTKLAHELAHAYTAKRFGLHVPQMGVALLLFFPCLYCDTTDAWQIADRRRRMAIGAAGVIAEAVLATLSTYVWYFSKPGVVNSVAFYLMGISLLSTIFFNGNPLLKFDGYFVLSDYLRIPNLYLKSFTHIKYLFMNRILGISEYESVAADTRERAIFTIYGFSSFGYRVFLYISIVAAVYFRFDKTLGLFLGIVAFGLFVIRPVFGGAWKMVSLRSRIRPTLGGGMALIVVICLVGAVLLVPIPRNSVCLCYLDSAEKQKLTVPQGTKVRTIHISDGTIVKQGEILFTLDTTLLDLDLKKNLISKEILAKELDLLLLDERRRAEAQSKEIELFQVEDGIRQIEKRLRQAKEGITAPFDGVVTSLDSRMKPGFQPGKGTIVGEVESTSDCIVHALIPQEDLAGVTQGQAVSIWFPVLEGRIFHKTISDIKPFSERDLRESPFSSRFGGELATETKSGREMDVPLDAYYDCSVSFPNSELMIPLGMTGQLAIPARAGSIASIVVESLVRTFNRESLL
jgi:putative peptide zinc metalloprotease protein